jgi:hypothetical protein
MDLISEDSISLQKIAQIFDDAYLDIDRSNSERLIVDTGSCRVLVMFDEEKKIVTFASIWSFKPGRESTRLELVNKLNSELILVRFNVTSNSTSLWCDQQFLVKGGISPKWLVFSLKRFGEVCSGAVNMHDEHFA